MENVAVLPVPDWAWAMTSRPWIMGRMARCWMAEGFSKSGMNTGFRFLLSFEQGYILYA